MNIKYYFRVLGGASFKKLLNVVDRAHEKSGKNKVWLFFDILLSIPICKAGYYDYLIFGFYNMTFKQRKTFVTRIKNKKLIMMMNNQEHSHLFENKNEFDELFKDFLHRDFRDLAKIDFSEFSRFMQDKEAIFCKPYSGESGKGIERLCKSDFNSLEDMFEYLKKGNFGVIEQQIVQHEDLSKIYPNAVNCYRIVTIVVDGKPHFVYATAKFGGGGKYVDNLENGGICCPIDPKTSTIAGCAHTSKLVNYDVHPDTGVKLMGYKLPYVKESIDLCLKAALVVDDVRYVGWDVYVSPDGPGIIEGNDYPGYDFWQLPEHTPDKTGLWPFYKSLVKGL